MPMMSVAMLSNQVAQDVLQMYKPDNWEQFEQEVLQRLQNDFRGAGVQSVTLDILQCAHPGPLALKFTIDSQQILTAQQVKADLGRA